MDPEKLQQAWQSQSCGTIGTNDDLLLKVASLQRRFYLFIDILAILFFLGVSIHMSWYVSRDIQRHWPWLFNVAGVEWVAGYMLFNHWRRRRAAAHYDESMLAHVEWSIKDMELTMRLDRTSPWWYILPIALGCMIPPLFFFAMNSSERPLTESLVDLLSTEGVFAFTFIFVHLTMKYGRRFGIKGQLQELQSLQSLRDSLLNAEE